MVLLTTVYAISSGVAGERTVLKLPVLKEKYELERAECLQAIEVSEL
jgi:hypothetical protein